MFCILGKLMSRLLQFWEHAGKISSCPFRQIFTKLRMPRMVNTPTLPTDSLYKMLTIAGIVMVIGGYALGWDAVKSISNSTEEVQLQKNVYERHLDDLDEEMSRIRHSYIEVIYKFREVLKPFQKEWRDDSFKMYFDYPSAEDPDFRWSEAAYEWRIGISTDIRNITNGTSGFTVHAPQSTEIAEAMKTVLSKAEAFEVNSGLHGAKKKAAVEENSKLNRIKPVLLGALLFSVLLFMCGVSVFLQGSINWYNQIQVIDDRVAEKKIGEIGYTVIMLERYSCMYLNTAKVLAIVFGVSLVFFSFLVSVYSIGQLFSNSTGGRIIDPSMPYSEARSVFI